MAIPSLSVILYADDHSAPTVDSVFSQAFSDFEILIGGNGVLMDKWTADSRLTVIPTNIGHDKYMFYNLALQLARGRYVCFLESGCICLPDCFKLHADGMKKFKNTGGLAMGLEMVDNNGNATDINPRFSNSRLKVSLLRSNPIFRPSVFFKTSLLKRYRLNFNAELGQSADYDFICHVSEKLSIRQLTGIGIRVPRQIYRDCRREHYRQSDIVRLRYLSLLAIEAAERELALHLKLMRGDPVDRYELGEAEDWVNKLLDANQKQRLFSPDILYRFFEGILTAEFNRLKSQNNDASVPNRTNILNLLIQKFNYKSYLEIGVNKPELNFDRINGVIKKGIDPDPLRGDIIGVTSDKYFEHLDPDYKFDLIFIDGLHHFEQVLRDIDNALKCLNEGGAIVCHDMLPESRQMQIVPRRTDVWTGDCWKAWAHLRMTRTDLEMFVINADFGIGVIRRGLQRLFKPKRDALKLNYPFFEKHKHRLMNVIDVLPLRNLIDYYASGRKITIDVVLVSDARNALLKKMTQHAIDTAGNIANVIIVESNRSVKYSNARVIYPDIPFNYNAYLNMGARHGEAAYVFFGNNDIVFSTGWEVNLVAEMKKEKAVSASPLCPTVASFLSDVKLYSGNYTGHELISRFCGWAFVWDRAFYERIGGLDEYFTFWCSDNAVVRQLLQYRQKHILVTSSIVQHIGIGRNTLQLLDQATATNYTVKEIEKYKDRFDKDIMGSAHFKIFDK